MLMLAVLLAGSSLFAGAGKADAKGLGEELIIVNKKTNELGYFRQGKLEKVFSVGTGKTSDLTPNGTFKIVNKIKNRPYYKEKIPGGDPANPLGDRWLGLDVNGTPGTTYAIHGNNNAKSIGKYVSAGCIRMHNSEVHWLYDQVKVGTKVVVTSTANSFETIAKAHGYKLDVMEFDGKLIINGKEQSTSSSMLMVDSRIYIPMRESFTLLGGTVRWNNDTWTVTAKVGDRTITHKPQATTATVNGKEVAMTASLLVDGMVMMPLRDVSLLTGYSVKWDNKTKTVSLSGGVKPSSK
ncbi:hypothetical protein EBB07_04755 [Paenibacillaceae bacterium]|nr:hypothetical protein EBB07_04755 [Paenibacillaceae bacterium]